jgi:hypothetical protein
MMTWAEPADMPRSNSGMDGAQLHPGGGARMHDCSATRAAQQEGATVIRAWPCWTLLALAVVEVGRADLYGQGSPAALPTIDHPSDGIVLCVPGAGGFPALCRVLKRAIHDDQLPLVVEPFEWTHGYLRVVTDHIDRDHAHEQGRRLAERICDLKNECPERPVYILSHSAGCAVTLAATEILPAGSVDRILLLAPAVSVKHDLRPALASSIQGVDVFYSHRDWATLGLGITLVGTADRLWSQAAGRVGFRPGRIDPADEWLFAKLRQHPWEPCQSKIGNCGGHYGAYQPGFLHAYVLPMLIEGGF